MVFMFHEIYVEMFVTAFFCPKTKYRTVETYFREFESLANTGVSILLFLDPVFRDRSFPSNVRVIPTALDTSWVPENVTLPLHRNPSKDTIEYFCIQLSKLYFLCEALHYTEDRYLAWIDFGAFHMFQNKSECARILQELETGSLRTDRILAPGCWDPGMHDWNSPCWRFCGTFLMGHRDLFEAAYTRQTELVRAHLPQLSWEVNYWACMDEYFEVYKANHDDTLLSRVMVFVQRHQGVDTCDKTPE
jgi:hypothetical protein